MLGDLAYQYDVAGNRMKIGGSFARGLLPAPVACASYDAANRQLTLADKSITSDANGSVSAIFDASGATK